MRLTAIIFLVGILALSCVKSKSNDPNPQLTFKSVEFIDSSAYGKDFAWLTIGYSDGDGNLFVNSNSEGPNFIMKTFYYKTDSAKFVLDKSFSNSVKQPADGYYKGKSITGDIIIPMNEYRSNNTRKILKFEVFMVDLAGNKSNIVTSPSYTITF